ncbi:MAG: sigma-54-dependent Fis family transcriptional regulator [Planctomycetota bacterium]|nr:MAG: sigma-54-dependent Fis family transcriptional regulator [Planctomycetota bacterium]
MDWRERLKWRTVQNSAGVSTISSAYRAGKIGFDHLRTGHPETRRLLHRALKIARTDLPVLVVGETGTGKNLLAQAIHNASGVPGDFVAVGPADLPKDLAESALFGHQRGAFTGADRARPGLIEAAAGGTLFIDEILELSETIQTKLLNVVDYRKYRPVGAAAEKRTTARLVVGIQGDPDRAVAAGRLRSDLLYRLKGAVFRLPPLRERGDDAVALAREFTEQAARRKGLPLGELTPAAIDAIRAYSWPGNVRELKRAAEVAVVYAEGRAIDPRHLGLDRLASQPLGEADGPPSLKREDLERWAYAKALERTGGNRRAAARLLGVSEATLYRRLGSFRTRERE